MTLGNIKNKVKVFYKRLSKDLNKSLSEEKCNDYVNHIEQIKQKLSDEEEEWIDDFSEIEQVSVGWFSERVNPKEIKETISQVHDQLDRICLKLGVEVEEAQNNAGLPQQVFNISQTQNQSMDIKIDILIENMVKEFEEEISKPNPDKSKLKIIMGNILKHGATYAPKIIDLLIKHWDKISFGGFGLI
ncbi:MAG: hypothetical protein KAI26_02600 [Nanoarchaeota archaeon]|nr:hypothetical protein [Nanoarchaeota archaeon]